MKKKKTLLDYVQKTTKKEQKRPSYSNFSSYTHYFTCFLSGFVFIAIFIPNGT